MSMESSHLVIFPTAGKFITKFNVLHCISFKLNTILDRDQGSNASHLNLVFSKSFLKPILIVKGTNNPVLVKIFIS